MTYCFDILTGIHSDILSKILSGILSDTYSDILSGILSEICSDILSGIYSDILSDICSDFLSGVFSGILHVYMYLTFSLACVQVQAPSTASRAGDMVFGSRALHRSWQVRRRRRRMRKELHLCWNLETITWITWQLGNRIPKTTTTSCFTYMFP